MIKLSKMHSYFLASFAFVVSSISAPAGAQDTAEADIRDDIEILASDEFAGRFPGTEGETKTLSYIAQKWSDAGLVSGTNDPSNPWYAPVELVQREPFAQAVQFKAKGRVLSLSDEIILRSSEPMAGIQNAPLIFVGHGVGADGKVSADVDGKIALMLFSNPPFESDAAVSFNDRRKVLQDAGAAAVLTVFNGGFPWERVAASVGSRTIGLASKDDALALDGVVSGEFMQTLAAADSRKIVDLLEAAQSPSFSGTDMSVTGTLLVSTSVNRFTSYNVIAKLPGKNPNAGAILMLGHWDHIGICRDESAEDRICNGAVDNASGIAVLIEAAKTLSDGPQLDRDIYFMGTTAEEQGLLGAYAYADAPNIPLEDIVIALNIDTIAIAPRDKPVAIIGRGKTGLDPIIEKVATGLGRTIDSTNEANAFIRRQDGWALAAKDVPSLMVGGSFSDMELLNKFLGGDYHGPDDEAVATMELGGAAQDTDLHIALARYFGDTEKYTAADIAKQKNFKPDEREGEKTGD